MLTASKCVVVDAPSLWNPREYPLAPYVIFPKLEKLVYLCRRQCGSMFIIFHALPLKVEPSEYKTPVTKTEFDMKISNAYQRRIFSV